MSPAAHLARLIIRAYQLALSPLVGNGCRFAPTCSHYGMEAVKAHGALAGGLLTFRRLLRCHPLAASGFDPVPPTPTKYPHL